MEAGRHGEPLPPGIALSLRIGAHRIATISLSGAMAAQQRLTGLAALPTAFRAAQAAHLYPDSKTLA